jgi:hypothetical protein
MRYFLDTEFNGFCGPLISLALVPEDDGYAPFYEAVPCPSPIPWVAKNVLPVLQTNPISRDQLAAQLAEFLRDARDAVIIADWPEDIAHAAGLLVTQAGKRLVGGLRFELLDLPGFNSDRLSETPHNAYYDALALRRFVLHSEA